jgi:hypothetical protein
MSSTADRGTAPSEEALTGDDGSEQGAVSERRWTAAVVLVVIVTKVVVLAAGVIWARAGELSVRDYELNFHHHRLIARYADPSDIRFFELWVGSDAQWYLAIAEDGYPSRSEIEAADATSRPKVIANTDVGLKYAFFPLWPVVIRATAFVVPDLDTAAFSAANVLSVVALLWLYRLLAGRSGRNAAFWTVTVLACWPFAMFLHVPFTESLFLLLSVATFAASEKRRWFWAGVCIGLASVTRPNGIALFVVPLVRHAAWLWRERRWDWRESARLLWLFVAALPIGAFLVHNAVKTGDPFYFTRVSEWWGYEPTSVLQNLWNNTAGAVMGFPQLPIHGFHRSQIDVAVMALWVFGLVAGVRVVPAHYTAYGAVVVLIPLMTKGDLMSFSRYALMAWPVFCVPVLLLKDKHRAWVLSIASFCLLAFQIRNMGEFVNWHWVG